MSSFQPNVQHFPEISARSSQEEGLSSISSQDFLIQFNQKIAEISARIIRAQAEALNEEIEHCLFEILEPLGIDRGGLLTLEKDSPVARATHIWYREGISHVSENVNLTEMFPWTYQKLVDEGQTIAVSDCSKLPDRAECDRQSHAVLGNKSVLNIPLFIGDKVYQIIAFNCLRNYRDWPEEIIDRLRLLGEIFVSAMERRDREEMLQELRNRLDIAAASADAGLWELDFDSRVIWATEKAKTLFGFAADEVITLDNFLEKIHKEDRSIMLEMLDSLSRDHNELLVEYRSLGPDGAMRWMQSRGRLAKKQAGRKQVLTGVTQDITRFKRLENQIKEQLQEIRKLSDQREKENIYLRKEVTNCKTHQKITGNNSQMQILMTQVEQVAKTESTVLLQGETGTGKEVIAQTIHCLSNRAKQIMVKVNCAALPAALVESELFGREKGAYTGDLEKYYGG